MNIWGFQGLLCVLFGNSFWLLFYCMSCSTWKYTYKLLLIISLQPFFWTKIIESERPYSFIRKSWINWLHSIWYSFEKLVQTFSFLTLWYLFSYTTYLIHKSTYSKCENIPPFSQTIYIDSKEFGIMNEHPRVSKSTIFLPFVSLFCTKKKKTMYTWFHTKPVNLQRMPNTKIKRINEF